MKIFTFRDANISDIPFLVETIVEAEKSGTDKLSYTTIFGLNTEEVKKYLTLMLDEEIDGCELSVTSFMVAEHNGKTVAAISAWVEGSEGIPSSVLKGNLLNYILPRHCIEKAMTVNEIIRELHIEYLPGTIQKGAGYVAPEFRGNNLLGILTEKIIAGLQQKHPEVNSVWTQIFSTNTPALRSNEKAGFAVVDSRTCANQAILKYLPSDKKFVMKRELSRV